MAHGSIPPDTDPEVYEVLLSRWRSMSTVERVALIDQINADVEMIAVTGITTKHRQLSGLELRHELARRRFGSKLADDAYRDVLAG